MALLNMKFAVIEYNSKSGDIWKHTPEHPNYLADPQKEIDTTSFGCYVSALSGEHIPLTKLIGANNPFKRIYRKITGQWPQNYSLQYLANLDVAIVVYDTGNGAEITSFTKRLKNAYPNIKLLGVPTQPYGVLVERWTQNPAIKEGLVNFMDACDAFLVLVRSTIAATKELTKTPIIYAPQPYPVEHAGQSFKPLASKNPIIFVAGVTERNNITKGQEVAVRLQKKFPECTIQVTKISDHDLDTSRLEGSNYKIVPFELWQEHLEYLSQVKLVINTDYTQTRGRVQVDSAAVGTISIGSNSDAQYDLYPEFASEPETSVDELVELGSRILSDNQTYLNSVKHAQDILPTYNYKQSARRITELIQAL